MFSTMITYILLPSKPVYIIWKAFFTHTKKEDHGKN